MTARARGEPADEGSVIPLVLGFVLLTLYLVAGSVAAGDAFTDQRAVQSICDGAAAAAAGAIDLGSAREEPDLGAGTRLPLASVQQAVDGYLARDPGRRDVDAVAALADAGTRVTVTCAVRESLAFGAMFGHPHGIRHIAYATAQAASHA